MKINKLVFALTFGLVIAAFAQENQPACQSTNTRKEIRTLSSNEWQIVKSTVTSMNRDKWGQWFSYLHAKNFNTIHGNSQFFPFHRRFLIDYESVGRRYNPSFSLPYWDEIKDYREPHRSAVLTSRYIGGNGKSDTGCVTDGILGPSATVIYPTSHCLKRKFDGKNGSSINAWYSPEYILSILQRDNTMAKFRASIEFSLHGAVHIGLGGDMVEQWSPNDFAFLIHHANIDRLWDQWQSQGHQWTFDGSGPDGREMTVNSNIVEYNEPISTVMKLGAGKACYYYDTSKRSANIRKRNVLDDITAEIIDGIRKSPLSEAIDGLVHNITNLVEAISDDLQESAKNIIITLSPQMVSKWFPSYAPLVSPEVLSKIKVPSFKELFPDFEKNENSLRKSKQADKQIPMPGEFSQSWVNMHKFDPAEFQRYVNNARDFVSDMRKANYAPVE